RARSRPPKDGRKKVKEGKGVKKVVPVVPIKPELNTGTYEPELDRWFYGGAKNGDFRPPIIVAGCGAGVSLPAKGK
ncbi:hypothetical protein COY52_11200, partial [Candidatus Desantisbacteria bacterium CG_4_10_14_0_8_um_filter_48_22]